MARSMIVSLLVVLLCTQVFSLRTLHVNTIEGASQSSVTINSLNSVNLGTTSTETRQISLSGGLAVSVPGTVGINAKDINLTGASSFTATAVDLSATVRGFDISGSTSATVSASKSLTLSSVGLNVKTDTTANVIADNLQVSAVNVRLSSAGPTSISANTQSTISGQDIFITGIDDVDVIAPTATVSITASQVFQAAGEVIDFDSFGDFSLVASTSARVRGGKVLRMEGNKISLSGTTGVDIISTDSSLKVTASAGVSGTSAGTVAVTAIDDVTLSAAAGATITSQGAVSVTGSAVQLTSSAVTMTYSTGATVTGGSVSVQSSSTVVVGSATAGPVSFTGTTNLNAISSNLGLSGSTSVSIQGTSEVLVSATSKAIFASSSAFTATATAGDFNSVSDATAITYTTGTFTGTKSVSFVAGSSLALKGSASFSSINLVDFAQQSIAIQGGSISMSAGSYSISGGAVTLSSDGAASITATNQLSVSGATFLATATIPGGLLSVVGTTFSSTTSNTLAIGSSNGVVSVSGTGGGSVVSLQSSKSFVSFEGNLVYLQSSNAQSFTSATSNVTSTTEDILINSNGALLLKATAGNETIVARRTAAFSSVGTTSLSTAAGDIVFTESTRFRLLGSQSISATASGTHLGITESGPIVGTSALTNDITFTSTGPTILTSNDLLITATRVTLTVTKDIVATAGNNINVRAEQQLPISFSTTTASTVQSNNASVAINAGVTTSLTTAATAALTATNAIQLSGAVAATLESATALSFTATNMTLASFGNNNLFSRTANVGFTSTGAMSFTDARSFLLNGGASLAFTADNFTLTGTQDLRVDASQILATGTTFTGAQAITTNVGTLTQTGGLISLQSADDIKLEANKRAILGAATALSITTPQNITFIGTTGTWIANNIISTATATRRGTSVSLLGGNQAFVFSDSGNDVRISSAQRVILTSGNAKPITFSGTSDRYVTAGSIDVQARGSVANPIRNNTLESISFQTSADQANLVLYSSGGHLSLQAPKLIRFNSTLSGFFTANGLVDAVNDLSVVTKAANNPGGINIQSYGVTHDPVYGTDTGITLHSEANGDVIVKSEKNLVRIVGHTKSDFTSETGLLAVFAGSDTTFTSGVNTNIVATAGSVSILAPLNNVTIGSGKDFDVQATRNVSMVAAGTVTLSTLLPITDPNNVALEFGSNSGDLTIAAQGLPSVIAWKSTADTTIESGGTTGITAQTNFTVNARGYIQLDSEAGTSVNVTDGQTVLQGQLSVFVTSSKNSDITIAGGQDQKWFARGGQIYHVSKSDYVMRTSGNDLELRTKATTGDLSVNSISSIAFQADGTDNTVAGGGVDGIFINAQNIDWSARNSQTWEVLGSVIIGSRSSSRVAIETGGDTTTNRGFVSTSEGNTVFTTQQSFNVNAFDFGINATSGVNINSPGRISLESLGTSGFGKDVLFQSQTGQLFAHASTVSIEAAQSATFQSGGQLKFESIGTDQVANQIKAQSANTFSVNVARQWNLQLGSWYTYSNNFNFQLDNDIGIRTSVGNGGSVLINSDNDLLFSSDYTTDFVASAPSGRTSSLTIDSYSANSPIEVSTAATSSNIVLNGQGTLTSTASTVTTIAGQLGVSIVAYDNSLARNAGDVIFNTFATFEVHAGNNVAITGGKAATLTSTAGVKDIELTSSGGLTAKSRSNTDVRALRGDLRVLSGRHLEFNTISDSQNGTLGVSSATSMLLTTHGNGNITTDNNGPASLTSAINVLFVVQSGGASFVTTATDADITVKDQAGGIDINGFTGVSLLGGYTDFSASRQITLDAKNAAGTGITVTSTELRGGLRFRSDSTPTGQSSTMFLSSGAAGTQLLAPGTETGQGWVNIDSASNIVFTETAGITFTATLGNVRTNGAGGTIISATTGSTFTSSGSSNGLGLGIQTTSTTNGTIAITTPTLSVSTTSPANLTLSTTSNVSPGGRLLVASGTDTKVTAGSLDGRGVEVFSTVPYSPVQLFASNSITGVVSLVSTTVIQLNGAHGVALDVPEKIDQGDVFNLNVNSPTISLVAYGGDLNSLTGAREGIIIKTTLDSSIYFAGTTTVSLRAGDSLLVSATNGAGLYGTTSVAATSAAGASLASFTQTILTGSSVSYTTTRNTFVTSNAVAFTAGTSIDITVGSLAAPFTALTEEPLVLQAQGAVTFTGQSVQISTSRNRIIDVTSDSILRIPFIFPRNGAALIAPTAVGCTAGTIYGGSGSFFYSPARGRLCYCTYNGNLVCF